jgi:uncharacterized protein DUF4439
MPPASPGTGREVRALERVLTAEQAAIYGYGVVGAHLAGTGLAAATTDWTTHEINADRIAGLLKARGVTPAPAGVAYQVPHRVTTAAQAAALAAALEDELAGAYLELVGLPAGPLRVLGGRQVRDAALRAATWRSATVAFPGLSPAALTGHPARHQDPGGSGATTASR